MRSRIVARTSWLQVVLLAAACKQGGGSAPTPSAGAPAKSPGEAASLEEVALAHNLNPDDARNALKVYVPPGKYDEFTMFTSGGQSGSIYVFGVPSLRLLKEIPVYSPNTWQGWAAGRRGGGSTSSARAPSAKLGRPRPGAICTTRSSRSPTATTTASSCSRPTRRRPRRSHLDLRDFKTKQILKTPNTLTDHGGVRHREHRVCGDRRTFQPSPGGPGVYAPIERVQGQVPGRDHVPQVRPRDGRDRAREVLPDRAAALLPGPHHPRQGPEPKDGSFINSLEHRARHRRRPRGQARRSRSAPRARDGLTCTCSTGRRRSRRSPRSGSQGRGQRHPRHPARRRAWRRGCIYFVPESKSPHGVDVAPGGEYIIVSGKLDPTSPRTRSTKIKKAIDEQELRGQGPLRRSRSSSTTPASRPTSRSASARCTRCSTTRATATPRLFLDSRGRQVDARAALQPGRTRRGRSSTRSPSTTTSATCRRRARTRASRAGKYLRRAQQVVGRSLPAARAAASAEPAAHRHQRPQDGAALGYADHRRAAQRDDDPDRDPAGVDASIRRPASTRRQMKQSAVRHRAGRGGDRARRQRP